jgi:hypothetical protein
MRAVELNAKAQSREERSEAGAEHAHRIVSHKKAQKGAKKTAAKSEPRPLTPDEHGWRRIEVVAAVPGGDNVGE